MAQYWSKMAIHQLKLAQLHFGKISERSQWKKSELFKELERKIKMIWKIEEIKFKKNPKAQQKFWSSEHVLNQNSSFSCEIYCYWTSLACLVTISETNSFTH